MKGYYRAQRGKVVAFRPPAAMRQRMEEYAQRKTRTLADQAEHFVKIGLMVSEYARTDDIDVVADKLKIPPSAVAVVAEQVAMYGGKIVNEHVEHVEGKKGPTVRRRKSPGAPSVSE